MTTPSTKALLRIAPIGAILVGLLVAALSVAPDTFRYRGWPTPPRTTPLQSLVGLSPGLGSRDPIVAAPRGHGAATTRAALGGPKSIAAIVPARTRGSRGLQAPAAGRAPGHAQSAGAQPWGHQGGRDHSSARRASTAADGNGGEKRSPAPESAKTVAQASSSFSNDGGPRPYLRSYYARHMRDEVRDGPDEQRPASASPIARDCEPAASKSAPPVTPAPSEPAARGAAADE